LHALQPVGNRLGAVDNVDVPVDHARDERPAVRQRMLGERAILVLAMRIRLLDAEPGGVRFAHRCRPVDEVGVEVVGPSQLPKRV